MHLLIPGGTRDERIRAARAAGNGAASALPLDSATLPFTRMGDVALPLASRALLPDEVELAFPNAQAGGTRLVLTQSTYLAGTYAEALAAYEEGQRRDPGKNSRQACRLAMIRLAIDDAAGAERDLWAAASGAPPEERDDLLLEAYEIGHALLAAHPALARHGPFLDRLGAEITKSE